MTEHEGTHETSAKKNLLVYQHVTGKKRIFLESSIYFSAVGWDIWGKCSNFAFRNKTYPSGLSPRFAHTPMLSTSDFPP
jgi:hypothetical protein